MDLSVTTTRCWKVYAEGNSYIVTDDQSVDGWLAGRINHLHTGFSGDGLIQVRWTTRSAATMRLTNADGSTAGLCVNGARGVTVLGASLGLLDICAPVYIHANGGTIRQIAVADTANRFRSQLLSTRAAKLVHEGPDVVQVDIGVPHRVVFTETDVLDVQRELAAHVAAIPGGTNVMFTHVPEPGRLVMRPWERGVGLVGGCASGAAAAVLACERRFGPGAGHYDIAQPRGRLVARMPDGVVELEGTAHVLGRIHCYLPDLGSADD